MRRGAGGSRGPLFPMESPINSGNGDWGSLKYCTYAPEFTVRVPHSQIALAPEVEVPIARGDPPSSVPPLFESPLVGVYIAILCVAVHDERLEDTAASHRYELLEMVPHLFYTIQCSAILHLWVELSTTEHFCVPCVYIVQLHAYGSQH